MLTRVARRLRLLRRRWRFRSLVSEEYEAGASACVRLRLKSGMTIGGGPNDDVTGIFNEIFVDRCYTPSWFYAPRPGQRVLDVGANIGVFPLFLNAQAPGIRVCCFEPHPTTYRQLVRNLEENRLGGSVESHQLAVAGGPGEVRFMEAAKVGSLGSVHQAAVASGQGMPVRSIGLADALTLAGDGAFDLLKVDTEGAEVEIIPNAPPTVWDRIVRVVVEYHDLAKRDQVERHLTSVGYRCRVVPCPGYEHHLGLIYAWRGGTGDGA